MKIILNEDVYNLGEEGDVCDVARGYARNYLFPKQLAFPYTKENIANFESRKASIEKRKEEKRQQALSLKERLDGKEVVITMNAGQGGKLFGSVTSTMIVEELLKEGIEVEKKKIDFKSQSVKMVGTYPVTVKLYENNEAELKLKVVSQGGMEQPPQKTAEEKAEEKAEKKAEEPESEVSAKEEAAQEDSTEKSAAAKASAETGAEEKSAEEAAAEAVVAAEEAESEKEKEE
ncbi:MAG: 50S ribosomal protein L9 [Spirochaetaceae bacterium]|nr:50S ribosomal protein L9 [Spirochaetaceae bacterium]MCF7947490.1 50S ribosomal protein L9 [Spirochaetia bacterium]MCF7950596.1 50S ribosomal protein L9 [Spirochaetaceae bacterium]